MKPFILLAAAATLSACTSDDYIRTNGVTVGSGNAIAANTVMQMVDPWPTGVQDTDLEVPAERPARPASTAGEGVADGTVGGQ